MRPLRTTRGRVALFGALASMLFLLLLAGGTRQFIHRLTYADIDADLQTLGIAIGSDLELQGIQEPRHDLRAGLEANAFEFRLENHSAILFRGTTPYAVSGDLVKSVVSPAFAAALMKHAEVPFTAVEPFSGQNRTCRFLVTRLTGRATGTTLVIFRSIEPKLKALANVDRALVAFVFVGFLGTAGILAIAVDRALRPVDQITRVTEAVEASDLSGRVSVGSAGEEFERLAGVINSLFERLEKAFEAQRRLVADAAHELRTPVAVLLGEAQEALRVDATDEERLRSLATIEGTARGLAREVDALLLLARADSLTRAPRQEVELADLVEEAVAAQQPAALARRVALRVERAAAGRIEGDRRSLLRLVSNLVANAVLYTDPGTEVAVRVAEDERGAVLEVRDHGPGIAPEDALRVFDRFVRLDGSRQRNPEGSGLGLAIVDQVARLHGATVAIESPDGGGALFRVLFPHPGR